MGLGSVFEGKVYIVGGKDVGLQQCKPSQSKKNFSQKKKKIKSLSCVQDHTAYLGRQNGQHIATVHTKFKDSKKKNPKNQLHTIVQIKTKCIIFCQH